ncbi:MAG: ATP-binding cassette domain-containing protein [Lachnospiraceae bacterium]|nr:ATP-binding cassette domain-containing protein [Lachnospiraceae bacterium]
MIHLEKVCKQYNNNALSDEFGVKNITLNIESGEFVFFVGKSGAGKSTLLKLILKDIDPTSGDICVSNLPLNQLGEKQFPYYRRMFGIISKEIGLLENKTVYQNLELVMRVTGQPTKTIKESIPKALGLVGMTKKMQSYPLELSEGERFKVLMARAIINNPLIVVADEPTANLDYETAWDIMNLFNDINKLGKTVLIATHATNIVAAMEKRVITIKDGRILSDVTKGKYGRVL